MRRDCENWYMKYENWRIGVSYVILCIIIFTFRIHFNGSVSNMVNLGRDSYLYDILGIRCVRGMRFLIKF